MDGSYVIEEKRRTENLSRYTGGRTSFGLGCSLNLKIQLGGKGKNGLLEWGGFGAGGKN